MVSTVAFQPKTKTLDLAAWHFPAHDINHKLIPIDVDVVSLGTTSANSPDGEDCGGSDWCSPSLESNDGPEVVSAGEFTAQVPWMEASVSSTGVDRRAALRQQGHDVADSFPSSGVDRRTALRQQGHEVLKALHVSKAPCRRKLRHLANFPVDMQRTPLKLAAPRYIGPETARASGLSWLEPTAGNVRTEPTRVDISSCAAFHMHSQAIEEACSDGVVFSL